MRWSSLGTFALACMLSVAFFLIMLPGMPARSLGQERRRVTISFRAAPNPPPKPCVAPELRPPPAVQSENLTAPGFKPEAAVTPASIPARHSPGRKPGVAAVSGKLLALKTSDLDAPPVLMAARELTAPGAPGLQDDGGTKASGAGGAGDGQPGNGNGFDRDEAEPEAAASRDTGAMLAAFQAMVRTRLNQAKHYPLASREQCESGTVVFSFTVQPDGFPLSPDVKESSGYPNLDQAALEAVQRAAPFLPFPEGFASGIKVQVKLKFNITNDIMP